MLEHIRRQKERGHRSKLETRVEDALQSQGLSFRYEKESFVYYRKGRYTPDFTVDGEHPFHIEVKGYWFPADRSRILAVVTNNPDMRLLVALQAPHNKITKTSNTTYAMWCQKHGICWSTIPIPQEVLDQWVKGSRVTMRVPGAPAATGQPPTKTAGPTVSSAKPTIESTETGQTSLFSTQCKRTESTTS